MKNYVQPGKSIPVTLAAAALSGGVVVVGQLVGVAAKSGGIGDVVEVCLEGVYEVPKEAALAVTAGDVIYWDAVAGEADKTNTNKEMGHAIASAAGAATTVLVRLSQFGV